MGLRKKQPRIEDLEKYVAGKKYDLALEAMQAEIRRNPKQFSLLLRQAEILGMAGHRDRAVRLYRDVAESQAREGFYARAIALYKKILRLDPSLADINGELARLIEEDRQSKLPLEERLRRKPGFKSQPPPPKDEKPQETDLRAKELEASSLFSSFGAKALEEILSSTRLRTYDEGDIIVTEGEGGSSLFLVVAGEVKVFTREEGGEHLPLAELSAGDFFGEVSVLTGKPRTATITAKTPVTAIELTKQDVDRISGEYPEVPKILEEFYNRRAQLTVEAVIGRLRGTN
jgi:cAMP-dependent protein kinase regulator